MMKEYSIAEIALVEAAHLLHPLRTFNTSGEILFFMEQLGYSVPVADLVNTFTEVSSKTEQVIEDAIALLQADTDEGKLLALIPLLVSVKAALDEIINLEPALRSTPDLAQNFVDNAPLDKLPKRLLDYLLFHNFYRRYPKIFGTLYLMGILEEEILVEDATIFQPPVRLKVVHWDRIPRYFTESGAVIDEIYAWNSDFDSDKFFARFSLFLRAMAIAGGIYRQSHTVKTALGNATSDLSEIRIPILSSGVYPSTYAEFGLGLTPAEAASGKKKGLALIPYLTGTSSFEFTVSEEWEAVLESSLSLDAGLGLVLRPPGSIEFLQNLFTSPQDAGSFGGAFIVRQKIGAGNIPKTYYLFGTQTTTHLSASDISLKFFGNLNSPDDDAGLELEIKKLNLLFTTGSGDSFIAKTLPNSGISADFSLGIGFSVAKALYFKGSAGIEIFLPTHIDLGLVKIQGITVAVRVEDKTIPVEVSANIKAELGPIQAVVENVGISTTLSFPVDGNGRLGPLDFGLSFKPPTGIGMSIDAGALVGGGYLSFDSTNEQYAGILQLEVKGGIALKAIGLLNTRMPDGSKGFSLLIIITAEFPPIQLGYGFTLSGVGGLIGVNRTMVVDVLRAGVKDRSLDSILFPQDPVANATKIISDLRGVFPVATGRFVFGPMVILGWGVPTMLTLELGILIELPAPVRVALIGTLTMILPEENAPVVVIHMDVLGVLDFDKGEVSIDATLYDSRIAVFALTGDMALRASWGTSPTFAVSAGGFNPRFQPPPGFPSLDRLALTLATSNNPRLRLEAYLALTSNTAQLGARVDLYAEYSVGVDLPLVGRIEKRVSVEAYLAFDTLIQFSPFGLVAELSGLAVGKVDSQPVVQITLNLTLTGPQPWHAWGEATFKFLEMNWRFPFDMTFGPALPQSPPTPPDPLERLRVALEDPRSWSAQLPGSGHMLVTLRKIEVEAAQILVHPLGELTLRQREVPLNVEIARFGSLPLPARKTFRISKVQIGTPEVTPDETQQVRDAFAPGQFFEMSDGAKLSRPAFEALPSGYTRLGETGTKFASGSLRKATFHYETVVIDKKEQVVRRNEARRTGEVCRSSGKYRCRTHFHSTISLDAGAPFPICSISTDHDATWLKDYTVASELMPILAKRGAAADSPMRQGGSARFAGPSQKVAVREPAHAVARKEDLEVAATLRSYTEAELVRTQMGGAGKGWQSVSDHEVRG